MNALEKYFLENNIITNKQAERERRACEGGRLLRPAGELGGFRLLDDGRAVQPLRVRYADGRRKGAG